MAFLLEVVAVIFGVVYVVLAAKNSNWCWIFGIIGSFLSIFLFIFYAKLYAEALLNVFYVIAGIYGWISWKKQVIQTEVYQHKWSKHIIILAIGTLFSFGLYYVISTFLKDAEKPLIDSFTTIFSIIDNYCLIALISINFCSLLFDNLPNLHVLVGVLTIYSMFGSFL